MNKMIMVAVATVLTGAAFAETTLSGLNLRIGLVYPTKSDVRDATKDYWFGAGVDYKLSDLMLGTESQVKYHLGLSVDWYQSGDARALPVLITATGSQGKGVYWLAGAGFSFNQFEEAVGSSTTRTRNETKFAYTVGLGYEFKSGVNPISLELRYHGNSRSEFNALGLYAGFKF